MELLDQDIILRNQNLNCPPHINPELEIICVKAGCLQVRYDVNRINLEAGQMILILPYHIHSFEPSWDCEAVVYMFSGRIYGELMKHYVFPAVYDGFSVNAAVMDYVEYLNNSQHFWQERIYAQSVFYAFLNDWIIHYPENRTGVNSENADDKVITFIFDHLSEELTIETIARQIGWNSRKLSKYFKKTYNIKLLDFIYNIRIERAATLLCTTGMSVTEVSNQCGFTSLRSFNRTFKNRMEMTPSNYRRKRQAVRQERRDSP